MTGPAGPAVAVAAPPAPRRFEAGPALAVGGVVAGVLVGERAGPGAARPLLAAGAAGLLLAWAVRGRARAGLAALAVALLATASMQRALDGVERSPLAAAVGAGAAVAVRGTLVTDASGPRFGADALLRVDAFAADGGAWRDAGGRTVVIRATGDGAGRLRVLAAGDRVTARGRLGPLDGFHRRMRVEHAVGVLDGADVLSFAPPVGALAVAANAARDVVLRGASFLPEPRRALLAGFLLGDTRDVPAGVVDDYRASGLAHLLAVSGANVAFALALVGPLLRRLPLGGRVAASLAMLLLFATMTRFEPSVLRACAMAACATLASLAGRPAGGFRVLALAVVALLLADPFLVRSVGFLLSAGASAGIVLLAPAIAARLPGPRALREPLAVTLAAQVGVAPVLVPVFGGIPLLAPVANLLAAPVAAPLGVYGLVASASAGVLHAVPGVAGALQAPTGAMVAWVTAVAHATARLDLQVDARALAVAAALSLTVGWVASGR